MMKSTFGKFFLLQFLCTLLIQTSVQAAEGEEEGEGEAKRELAQGSELAEPEMAMLLQGPLGHFMTQNSKLMNDFVNKNLKRLDKTIVDVNSTLADVNSTLANARVVFQEATDSTSATIKLTEEKVRAVLDETSETITLAHEKAHGVLNVANEKAHGVLNVVDGKTHAVLDKANETAEKVLKDFEELATVIKFSIQHPIRTFIFASLASLPMIFLSSAVKSIPMWWWGTDASPKSPSVITHLSPRKNFFRRTCGRLKNLVTRNKPTESTLPPTLNGISHSVFSKKPASFGSPQSSILLIEPPESGGTGIMENVLQCMDDTNTPHALIRGSLLSSSNTGQAMDELSVQASKCKPNTFYLLIEGFDKISPSTDFIQLVSDLQKKFPITIIATTTGNGRLLRNVTDYFDAVVSVKSPTSEKEIFNTLRFYLGSSNVSNEKLRLMAGKLSDCTWKDLERLARQLKKGATLTRVIETYQKRRRDLRFAN